MSYLNKSKLAFCFFVICISFSNKLLSQQIPTDFSKVKASQITDAQLFQVIEKAKSAGLTQDDVIKQFQDKGMSDPEVQILSDRIRILMPDSSDSNSQSNNTGSNEQSNKRSFKGDLTSSIPKTIETSRIFGAELFSSADPLFVPNLKIATPRNYVIGPEDELQLDIYGNNISSQKLVVSPDGFINIKYAGPVNLGGTTIEQAAGVLKARLTKYYPSLVSGETKLQLTLGSIRSIQVTIVGAVRKPGTMTLPSLATFFNALYTCGGPADNGSYRNIELVRSGKTILIADLYDFMLKGDQTANIFLRDNDVIRVPYVQTQIVLDGGLNKTGIFEIKNSETLASALSFAGGFKGSAFKGRITGTRYTDVERKVIDVARDYFSSFKLENGDSLYVDSVVNRFQNRVIITGAVFKPGAYALDKDMDLSKLIDKAQGLKEDAFTGRANMVRLRENKTKEYKSLDINDIISGKNIFVLKKEDSIHIVSILEIRDSTTVKILGPVKSPGDYKYEDSLSLQALILQAGGFMESATPSNIEIGRRLTEVNLEKKGEPTSEILIIKISKDLTSVGSDVFLKPFDVISIKVDPYKSKQISINLSGQIVYPGNYTLTNPEEKLSSIVKRAGGLLPYADIAGAKLVREKVNIDTVQIKRMAVSNVKLSNLKFGLRDTSNLLEDEELRSKTIDVPLDLKQILDHPGNSDDITLQNGDMLVVPRFVNTISVNGEVMKPLTIQFQKSKGFSNYLSDAGGFTKNAYRKKSFIVYSNGRSARTHIFFGFRIYPRVTPGGAIYIPSKPIVEGFDPTKASVLLSSLSTLVTVLLLVKNF